jgi:hypothetical protein
MIIIKEELRIFNSSMISYNVFDDVDEFNDYKIRMELLDSGTPKKRTYTEMNKTILKFLVVDAFKDTTMENFIKIQEIIKIT